MEQIECHEKSCHSCNKFKCASDWWGDYFLCGDERFPHQHDFVIIDWIDKHGCVSWEGKC